MSTPARGSGVTITSAAAQAARDAALGKFRAKFIAGREKTSGQFKDAGVRIYEFESGLVWQKSSEPPSVYRWDRIARVYQISRIDYVAGSYAGTWFSYKIIRDDGASMRIGGAYDDPRLCNNADPNSTFSKYEPLGRSIVLKVSTLLLPRALETLNKGESLTFGDVTISVAGVRTAKQALVPWSEIAEVKVDKGQLKIKKVGKILALYNQPASRTPNLPLFITLVDALRRQG